MSCNGKREGKGPWIYLIKPLIPFMRALSPWMIHLPKLPFPYIITLKIRIPAYDLETGTSVQITAALISNQKTESHIKHFIRENVTLGIGDISVGGQKDDENIKEPRYDICKEQLCLPWWRTKWERLGYLGLGARGVASENPCSAFWERCCLAAAEKVQGTCSRVLVRSRDWSQCCWRNINTKRREEDYFCAGI